MTNALEMRLIVQFIMHLIIHLELHLKVPFKFYTKMQKMVYLGMH